MGDISGEWGGIWYIWKRGGRRGGRGCSVLVRVDTYHEDRWNTRLEEVVENARFGSADHLRARFCPCKGSGMRRSH